MQKLSDAIEARSSLRGLRTDLQRLRYASRYIFSEKSQTNAVPSTLFLGVGHGLDAVLARLDGCTNYVVGVDPYIADDGNDDEDYARLNNLIDACGVSDRFEIHRCRFDEYQPNFEDRPMLIVINDVLHHIFTTTDPLRASPLMADVIEMFLKLCRASAPGARLVVSDVNRRGLRQALVNSGLLNSAVRYSTKQDWSEWDAAITEAGWKRVSAIAYVPYPLRHLRPAVQAAGLSGILSDRYYLTYSAGNNA